MWIVVNEHLVWTQTMHASNAYCFLPYAIYKINKPNMSHTPALKYKK